MEDRVRPIAIGIFERDGRLLVMEGRHEDGHRYYRPLGGSVEFGERGDAAVAREIREEIGAEVRDLRYLGTLENIFTYHGERGHEIVLVYEGRLADETFYARESFDGIEDNGETFRAAWIALDDVRNGALTLYPDDLLALLDSR